MSKENLERFMTRVADSKDLQAKIGEEITGDALVALGAAHGCEFSIEDVQVGAAFVLRTYALSADVNVRLFTSKEENRRCIDHANYDGWFIDIDKH